MFVAISVVVLLLGGAAVLAFSSGMFDEGPVEEWAGASLVNSILEGQPSMTRLTEQLGTYDQVGTYSNNLEWVRYEPADASIATVTAWLDGNRVARWIRIDTAGPATYEQVQASVNGMAKILSITPGNPFAGRPDLPGEMCSGGPVYVYVVDGQVREIWLVPMDVRRDEMRLEMYGEPGRTLDVSGAGLDPRSGR